MLAVEDLSANWEPLSMLGLAWAHRMMYRSSNWAQMNELDDGKTRWREFWWKIGSSKAVVDPALFMFQFHLCTKAFEGICWVKLQFCKWIPHSMRLWSLLLVIAILRATSRLRRVREGGFIPDVEAISVCRMLGYRSIGCLRLKTSKFAWWLMTRGHFNYIRSDWLKG